MLEMMATWMELHDFRGLYIVRWGGGISMANGVLLTLVRSCVMRVYNFFGKFGEDFKYDQQWRD